MDIDTIGAVGAAHSVLPMPSRGMAPAPGFAQWFAGEVGKVNDSLVKAQDGVQKLATGQAVSLHETMIRMEEAKLSFQLLAQVRTRMLEAYQEIMRTQV